MSQRFPTTQWSEVLQARDGSESQARRALEELCGAYWFPLYAYVRRRGHSADDAKDLTQGFFADLLSRRSIATTDRAKGRFRSFLLASLEHFLSHQRDRAAALKRGGHVRTVSLDAHQAEDRYRREPADRMTPERVFERRWGLAVMERAMERLQMESTLDEPERFERLKHFLTGDHPQLRYREVAAGLGMSETAVKAAVHRLRRRYGVVLREEIAATLADPAEIDDELRHLLTVVRPWRDPGA